PNVARHRQRDLCGVDPARRQPATSARPGRALGDRRCGTDLHVPPPQRPLPIRGDGTGAGRAERVDARPRAADEQPADHLLFPARRPLPGGLNHRRSGCRQHDVAGAAAPGQQRAADPAGIAAYWLIDPKQPTASAGPYHLDKWDRGRALQLSAYTGYSGPTPSVRKVDIAIEPDK